MSRGCGGGGRGCPGFGWAGVEVGADACAAFWTGPLSSFAPGIIAAALLALTVSFDDYVITSMVEGVDSEALPMVIYAMARRRVNPVLNAVSTVVVVALGALVLISERLRAS